MASQWSGQQPDAELQAAFRRHLPQRLHTLLRRARTQCRSGWDVNVLRVLHDEIALLAGVCGRYGMLEVGERLLALEQTLQPAIAARAVPDVASSARIEVLLDSLRPHLQQAATESGVPTWVHDTVPPAVRAPFPRCEVPPPGYRAQPGAQAPKIAAVAAPAAAPAPHALRPPGEPAPRGTRIRIVNDDHALLHELLLALERQQADVALLDGLDGLLELLAHSPPELAIAIIDVRTPLDRLAAALHQARRDPARRTRLLALLRDGDLNLRLQVLRAGADRCLPLSASTAEVVAVARELAGDEHDDPYRVLIVDDDAPQALFAQAILRRAGMQTKIIDEALAVLDELDQFHPDLLLMDLNMPHCDGFELTALIREREGYVSTPIVFLSGEQDEDRQFAALDAGADDFLIKPIRPAHLTSAVTNRIRRARAAHARSRRRREGASGLQPRARLLDALSEHFAAAAGRAATGGLVAVRLRDAEVLSQRLGTGLFELLLAEAGNFIAGHVRRDVLAARHENGYLLFGATGSETELLALARHLLASAAEQRFTAQAVALQLECGVCAFTHQVNEPAAALAAIGQALATARAGADGIGMYPAGGDTGAALATQISAALAADAFGLAFQPILPVRGAAAPHYQALLRLQVDAREHTAAELVPAAVRAGLIGAVDAWVVGHCMEILAQRLADGENLRLVASQSLAGWQDPARRAQLLQRLAATDVEPDRLVLEFRCEDARGRLRLLAELAEALSAAGVRLSLAGFGTEAAAAGWIDHLPLDYIKLDPALAEADLRDAVRAAHACNLRVIAPRVETAAHADALRLAGVDMLQGSYFQPPAATLEEARREDVA